MQSEKQLFMIDKPIIALKKDIQPPLYVTSSLKNIKLETIKSSGSFGILLDVRDFAALVQFFTEVNFPRNIDGTIILCFSLNDKKTFDNLPNWL